MILTPWPKAAFLDNNGDPLVGGQLFTYTAGTNNKLTTYKDSDGLSQNTNPIILDFRGEASVWLDPLLSYKFVLAPRGDTDPPGKPIWSVDGISTFNGLTADIIGHILWPRSQAEINADVTPLNYGYIWGDYRRYGGDPSAIASVNDAALTDMLAVSASHEAYVPSGIYNVSQEQIIPDFATIVCDGGADFWFDDGGSGGYLFTNGIVGQRGGFLRITNLSIVLRTVTAKGLFLLNSIKSVFNSLYVEGRITDNWPTGMSTRTNVGVYIDGNGQDSFFNTFNTIQMNHCHTGIYIDAGPTQQIFNGLFLFGDSIYGDTEARGLVAVGGQDSIVYGGYCEAYDNTAGFGALCFSGPLAVRWRVHDIVFDHGVDPGPINMNAIVLEDAGGDPSDNSFLGCYFTPNTFVNDGTEAADGNFIESNPNISQTWTATLVPLGSGSITLNSGVGGNTCFYERRGKNIRVWGVLSVASVSSPVGRLQIQGLPFAIVNNNGNQSAVSIRADLLTAAATTALQGYGVRGSSSIEIELFAAGAASTTTANVIKATSELFFSCSYVAA